MVIAGASEGVWRAAQDESPRSTSAAGRDSEDACTP